MAAAEETGERSARLTRNTPSRTVLLVALLLRLVLPAAAYAVARDPTVFITPDSFTYLAPAESLVSRGAFLTGDRPETFRTPGYPLLLALGVAAGHPFLVTLLLQAIVGTFAVWCVMRTASLLHDASPGTIGAAGTIAPTSTIARRCGWLIACEPLTLVVGARLLADSLLASLVALLVLLIVAWLRGPTLRVAIGIAVTLAAAAYVKPIAYYLVVPLFAWLGLQRLARRQVAIACLIVVMLLGAWHVRNGVQTGFWGFSTLTARALFVGAGGSVSAAREGRPFGEIRHERMRGAGAGSDVEAFHVTEMYARGLSDLIAAPGTALRLYVMGLALTLFDPGSLDYLRLFDRYPTESPVTRYGTQGLHATLVIIARHYPAVLWCSVILELVLLAYLILALRGVWRMRRAGIPELRLLILVGLYFLLLAGGIFGTARFRAPVMPIVVLIAGYGWWRQHGRSSLY